MVEIRGLTKVFGDTFALREVDLDVSYGQFLTIFGPNGAGKTTLLRVLATLTRPTSGKVLICGQDIAESGPRLRRHIGFVPHQPLIYGDLSPAENLRFYGLLYDVPDMERRIEELLHFFGLSHRRDSPVRTFSRGMQQRLSLARAILHNPTLLLLDEPYTGLDKQAAATLSDFLREAHDGSRTVVMATHDLEQGLALCDRAALLVEGRIVHQAEKGMLDAGNFKAF
ncbi:MAG: heme ABC exporter ATP-binding protein CcmA [Anaerolineae bacterium]